MSTFFADYGLWLLIALLVIIVAFLFLSGKKDAGTTADTAPPVASTPPVTKTLAAAPPEAVVPKTAAKPATLVGETPPAVKKPAVKTAVAPKADAPKPATPKPAAPKTVAPKPAPAKTAAPKAAAKPASKTAPAPTPAPAPAPARPAAKKAAAKPAPASPAPVAAPAGPDDLLLLKGVGPKLNTMLIGLGVTRFAQIAAWTDADLATVDAQLGTFRGRPVRDHWIDQAQYLAAGDTAGFEAKYGKL